jgi:predicted TIM-barrel fold metal-dependent hydrolase
VNAVAPSETRPLVIDAHHHVGALGEPGFTDEWAAADMARRRPHMERLGIDRCVVQPAPGSAGGFRNVDHATMNDSIARYAQQHADVVEGAAATVNPAEVAAACREMERAFTVLGLQAVTFHHRFLGMQLNDPRMDDLLRVAAEHGRTVIVHIISDSTLEAPWRLLAMAKRFPEVRFLALDGFSSSAQAAMIRSWAPDVANVWFDTGAMISVGHGMQAFIDACGADRLVFGTDLYSGSPHFEQAFPLVELMALGLPGDALAKVCNGNVRALLGPSEQP